MSSDISVRNTTLHIEDTERKKALGHPEPVKSGLLVFDPSAEDLGEWEAPTDETDAEPIPHH